MSVTYLWKIKEGMANNMIFLPLISIDLPDKIGTSPHQYLKKGLK